MSDKLVLPGMLDQVIGELAGRHVVTGIMLGSDDYLHGDVAANGMVYHVKRARKSPGVAWVVGVQHYAGARCSYC